MVAYVGNKKISKDNWPSLNLNKNHLSLVKKGMDRVVNHKDGTAYGARIQERDMLMGGKTGTAQVKKINRADRARGLTNDDLEWKYRHHALFVGYAPLNNPKYVCSVVVEHGGGGSAVAAPVARDILLKAQERDPASTKIKLSDNLPEKKVKHV